MKNHQKSGGLVYSTEQGRVCPTCRQAIGDCACKTGASPQPGDGVARISGERRNGKIVTLIKGLGLDATALQALGKQIRTACGAGGTVKDFCIEIQGDHGIQVALWLEKQSFKVRRKG